MEVTSKLTETYVPKFNKNRELPKAEQVVVTLKYLTIEEFEPFAGERLDTVGLLKKCIVEIKNLRHNKKPVTTGEELVKCIRSRLSDLAVELSTKILLANRIEEEEEKNSEGQLSSS